MQAYNNSRTIAYNLTAGEIDLNDSDKSKSTSSLYPASQLIINKDGQQGFRAQQKSLEAGQHYRLEPGRLQRVATRIAGCRGMSSWLRLAHLSYAKTKGFSRR